MPTKKSYLTVTDQFCGAGGSAQGASKAGFEIKMALNHWEMAIETYSNNFPNAYTDCTDISASNPRRYPSTDLLIATPECTNHTHAQGKKRKHQGQYDLFDANKLKEAAMRSRATMWDVPRFAEYHDYNHVIVENVIEARKWRLWNAWLQSMHDLGYNHKTNYLNSMFFHPCPQSRDRMYVVFWKKGNKAPDLEFRPIAYCKKCGCNRETFQWWKRSDKKWGRYNQSYLYRCSHCNEISTPYYHASFNIIDWTRPGTRIGDRKRKLADNTIKRIEFGLDKYSKDPMIITNCYSSGIDCRIRNSIIDPMQTQTGDYKQRLLVPFLANSEHVRVDRVRNSMDPMWTQVGTNNTGVVMPFIIEMRKNGKAKNVLDRMSTITAGGNHHILVSNYSPGWTRGIEREMGSVTTSDSHALLTAPIIVENKGKSTAKSSTSPLGSITTVPHHGLLTNDSFQAFMTYYYRTTQVSHISDPIRTVTGVDKAGVVFSKPNIEDCFYRTLLPHEIQRGMAFADDYKIVGNSKQVVRQLGNAVTPPAMDFLCDRVRMTYD